METLRDALMIVFWYKEPSSSFAMGWARKSSLFFGHGSKSKDNLKKFSISFENLDSHAFLENPRYSFATLSLVENLQQQQQQPTSRQDSVECKPVDRSKEANGQRKSIFSRSASFIGSKYEFFVYMLAMTIVPSSNKGRGPKGRAKDQSCLWSFQCHGKPQYFQHPGTRASGTRPHAHQRP